tara:strand:- start:1636 stop:2073 length:438 start_codon:yes stop_codon:yes gene_type:complete
MEQSVSIDISAEAFWRYSLQRYQSAQLQEQLLHLQDDFQGQVNLALMCLWLDDMQLKIETTLFDELEHALASTSENLVPLRAARRLLKKQLNAEQYQQLLNIELEIEKQQQQSLVACLDGDKLISMKQPKNFEFYLERLGVTELT